MPRTLLLVNRLGQMAYALSRDGQVGEHDGLMAV